MRKSNQGKEIKREKLVQTKVRLSEKTDADIRKIAKDYKLSIAFVVRFTLERRLSEYFSTIRYI